MKKFSMAVGAAIALAGVTAPAQAQVSWNFTSGNFEANGATPPSNGKCKLNNNNVGNVASCDGNVSGTQSLKVRGFAFNGSGSSSTASAGLLGKYSGGLGNCNTPELSNCSDPNHMVDNYNFKDFLLLQTVDDLTLQSVSFGYVGEDADFSIFRYTGATDPLTSLTGGTATPSNMISGGWSMVATLNKDAAGTFTGFNAGNLSSKYWIIAAHNPTAFGGTCPTATWNNPQPALDCNDDEFKVSGVSGLLTTPSITSVPEPSTYALMGAGLLGIFGFARRRRINA